MKFENQIIQKIDSGSIDVSCPIYLSNCIIDTLDFVGIEFEKEVIIRRCIITNMDIYSSWFSKGLIFVENLVLSDIDYEMGGHNKKDIIIEQNIFKGFFSFFDCCFEKEIVIRNNIFTGNSDLLLQENKGFDNIFENGYIVENNIGRLDMLRLL